MNVVDSLIAGVALISVLVVVVIITRSLKNVDKEIIEDIQNGRSSDKKKKFTTKLKQAVISFLEWIIRKMRKGMQSVHFWAIKAKRKSKSDVLKAKDELLIQDSGQDSPSKKKNKKRKNKKNKFKNKMIQEGDTLEKMSVEENDIIMDSVVKGADGSKEASKKSFFKGLFKSNTRKKKSVDIKKISKNSSEEWSLDNPVVDDSEKRISEDLNEGVQEFSIEQEKSLGLDREILEKKILQRIDKDPTNINNYHELGELYIKMKKYNDANEVFGYVLSVNPDDSEAKRRQDKIKLLKGAEL